MEDVLIHSEPVKKTNWVMLALISGIVIVLIIFALFLFIIFNKQTATINQQELSTGKDFNLKQGENIIFNVNDSEKHALTVDSMTADSVTISIQSEKITLTLNTGEEKLVDVNQDGQNDVVIKLIKIENGKPYFNIRKTYISEINANENNSDTSGDINTQNPQNQNKSCQESGGTYCAVEDGCNGNFIASFDSDKCCNGACIKQSTDLSKENLCGSISCNSNQRCIKGVCELVTCSINEVGKEICYSKGKQTCNINSDCNVATQKCTNGLCEWNSCSSSGGKICDVKTESCSSGKFISSLEGDSSKPSGWSQYCCIGNCMKSSYDISLSGPIKITGMKGAQLTCYGTVEVEFEVTSTFPEKASLGSYDIYLDDVLAHTWTPLNVVPGTNKFYGHLDWVKDQESFQKIKVIFDCGNWENTKESSCENNQIEEVINYEQMNCP